MDTLHWYSVFSSVFRVKAEASEMLLKIVIVTHLFFTLNGESLEEMSPFLYSNAGSSVNFNDIFPYTNSLVEGNSAVSGPKEEEYNLHINPSQLVEFSTKKSTEYYTTPTAYTTAYTTTPPLPQYVLNLQLIKDTQNQVSSISPYSILTKNLRAATRRDNYFHTAFDRSYKPQVQTTEKYCLKNEIKPIDTTTPATTTKTETPHRERGILDLLFPPKRVKAFKNIFDSVKSILSYTFKR